jgi:C_GCAxxG_C_C family probable redox protein
MSHATSREEALAGFRDPGPGHRNCAQTVLWYAFRQLGEEPSFLYLARFLGGGLGRSGRLCGAVSGTALAFALLTERRPGLTELVDPGAVLRGFVCDFEDRFGHVECRELTQCNLSNPEELQRFREEGLSTQRCEPLLQYAFEQVERLARGAGARTG